jgi:hypothetical protein
MPLPVCLARKNELWILLTFIVVANVAHDKCIASLLKGHPVFVIDVSFKNRDGS